MVGPVKKGTLFVIFLKLPHYSLYLFWQSSLQFGFQIFEWVSEVTGYTYILEISIYNYIESDLLILTLSYTSMARDLWIIATGVPLCAAVGSSKTVLGVVFAVILKILLPALF